MENEKTRVGFNNQGQLVVKNRAYRRRWKNLAQIEGRKSKKYYTTKRKKNRRK